MHASRVQGAGGAIRTSGCTKRCHRGDATRWQMATAAATPAPLVSFSLVAQMMASCSGTCRLDLWQAEVGMQAGCRARMALFAQADAPSGVTGAMRLWVCAVVSGA